MKKIFLVLLSTFSIFFARLALAVCPICTIAVASGLGLSRWIGIDDSIAGLWIGGFTVSMILLTISKLQKNDINFKAIKPVIVIGYYLIIFIILYFSGIIGDPINTLSVWGLDKIIIGIVVGSIGFWLGAESYCYLKEKNGGLAYFPFQKVVMPIIPLITMSIIFYLLTKL